MWDLLSNLWDPETNVNGYLSVGIAENSLLRDTLLDYVHDHIKLSPKHLTYNDGGMGSNPVRQAIARFLNRKLNPVRGVEPSHVAITNGCSTAIEHVSWAFAEPGEGILLGRPYYGAFVTDMSLRPGAEVVTVDFGDVDPVGPGAVAEYKRAADDFEARTGKRARAVMLCHPHNPLGRCYPRSVIVDLMKFCQERQMHLISDEIYALSVWENKVDKDVTITPFESVLSIDTNGIIDPDLVHVLWGMSKDFGANGLRVGAVISQSNPDFMTAFRTMSLYSFVSGMSDQITTSILLDDDFTDTFLRKNQEKLSEAYTFVANKLKEHNIEYVGGCNAGFFVWVNLGKKYLESYPNSHDDERDLTGTIMQKLLDNKVFLANGTTFGSEKPGWFRIVFAHPTPYLEEAMKRILAVVETKN